VNIYRRKEIENFLLVPSAIDRAASRKIADQAKRGGKDIAYHSDAAELLDAFAVQKKTYVTAQYLANRKRFERTNAPNLHEATISEAALVEFDGCWRDAASRLEVIPGKEAIAVFNQHLQEKYGISITHTSILDAMRNDEIAQEMKGLIIDLDKFSLLSAR
ncbi:MAG TPA: hypothetical protein VHP59_31355, partial [Vineibacter terrae]|nr:hypothetical protein [Vineibacter terrae]